MHVRLTKIELALVILGAFAGLVTYNGNRQEADALIESLQSLEIDGTPLA